MGGLLYKHRFNLVAAIIGVFVTILLWQSGTPTFIRKPIETRQQADIYIDALVTEKFNTEGHTVYRLRADRAQHWPDSNETTLIEPQIIYYAPQVWYTHAHSGIIHPGAEKITLRNGVNLHRESGSSQLLTPYLFIEPDAKIATTPADVKVITPDGVTNAKGLRVDMAEDRIKLMSHVSGDYTGAAFEAELKTELNKTEPGTTEPDTEPGKAEPSTTGPNNTEAKTDSDRPESNSSESNSSESNNEDGTSNNNADISGKLQHGEG